MRYFGVSAPTVDMALRTPPHMVASPTTPTASGLSLRPAETWGVESGLPSGIGTTVNLIPAAPNAPSPICWIAPITEALSVANIANDFTPFSAAYFASAPRTAAMPPVHR